MNIYLNCNFKDSDFSFYHNSAALSHGSQGKNHEAADYRQTYSADFRTDAILELQLCAQAVTTNINLNITSEIPNKF